MANARAHAVSNVVNGKIYVFGGFNGGVISDVEEYDPTTDSWSTVSTMPTPRRRLASGEINGRIYTIGGISTESFSAVVEKYTPPAP